MKPSQISSLDLKRRPTIAINKNLNKFRDTPIPQIKIDNFEDALKNTNLRELIDTIKQKRITKP